MNETPDNPQPIQPTDSTPAAVPAPTPPSAPAPLNEDPTDPIAKDQPGISRVPTVWNVIETLLKEPIRLFVRKENGSFRTDISLRLLLALVGSLAVFGVLIGSFSGGVQCLIAPLKIVLGTLVAALICLPSLYIFCTLGGLNARISNVIGLLLSAVALTGVLMIGFAPVVWVFCQSAKSPVFIGFLGLLFWGIGLTFGMRLLLSTGIFIGVRNRGYLVIWTWIFTIVCLQMTTAMRPIVGTAPTFFPQEKKFFLEYWAGEVNPMENTR